MVIGDTIDRTIRRFSFLPVSRQEARHKGKRVERLTPAGQRETLPPDSKVDMKIVDSFWRGYLQELELRKLNPFSVKQSG